LPYDAPYTATDSTLTVVTTTPYDDSGKTVGWTVIVDDYILVTSKDASIPPRPAVGASSPPAHSARDPRCPASVPAANAPCNPGTGQPLECEYGGDAYGQCTTIALCALQGDGTFAFQLEPSVNCVMNDASCPASYQDVPMSGTGSVVLGSVCRGGVWTAATTITCGYPEAVCVCTEPPSSTKCACRLRSEVSAVDGQGGACSAKRPLAGDSCATEGMLCVYEGFCGWTSLGVSMACLGGYWEPSGFGVLCPARQGC
jgi:hypothetical protein